MTVKPAPVKTVKRRVAKPAAKPAAKTTAERLLEALLGKMAGIEAYLSGASDDHLEMHKTAHRFDGSLDHLNELVKRLGTTINNVHGRLNSLETQIANLGLRDSFPPRPAPCTYQPPYCTPRSLPERRLSRVDSSEPGRRPDRPADDWRSHHMNRDEAMRMMEDGYGPEIDAIAEAKRLDDRLAKFGRRLLAYTAGPYRDPRGEWYVRQNIRAAEAVARELWAMGFAVICPHKNTANMGGSISGGDCLHEEVDVWLEGDLEMVARCDLVVMLPGWQTSEGSKVEHRFARHLATPVFYWPECRVQLKGRVANVHSPSALRLMIQDRSEHIDRATGRAEFDRRNRHARRATEAPEVATAPACGYCQGSPG